MKRRYVRFHGMCVITLTWIFILVSTYTWAGNDVSENNSTSSNTYYIDAPRFVRPLIEKWITEYKKVAPEANFAIAKSAVAKKGSKLNVLLSEKQKTNQDDRTVFFAKYAILPITAKNSDAEKIIAKKAVNKKGIKKIFFEQDDDSDDTSQLTVYVSNSANSIAVPFAAYFGENTINYRGRRIAGDDVYLNQAVENDTKGVSINTLQNIYDLSNRKLKDGLSILISGKGKADAWKSIDDAINYIEQHNAYNVDIEKIGLAYKKDEHVDEFISWILKNGENYNHEYGFLKLNDNEHNQ